MDKSIVPAKTFVLKANIHCSGCERKMKKLLQRVNGVHTISIDADQSKITISGTIDPQTVLKHLEGKIKSELLWEPINEENNLQVIDQKQQYEKSYYGIDHNKDIVKQLQQISEIKGVKSVDLTRDKLKLTYFKEHDDDNINCKDCHGHGANCCAKKSTRAMHGYTTNKSDDYNENHGTCYARNSACAMHHCNECRQPLVSPCRCTNSHANIPVGLPWRPGIYPSAPPEYYDTPPPPPPPPPPPMMYSYSYRSYDNSFSDENPRGCTIL